VRCKSKSPFYLWPKLISFPYIVNLSLDLWIDVVYVRENASIV